jgi:1-deoxy-D-xylulose-5-phosphate reductoisomerase
LEVIEAFKLFPFNPDKYKIIIHPQSLVHAIFFFKNGQTKFLYHETDMLIPIANAIYENKIDIETLGGKKNSSFKKCQNLNFQEIDKKKFPIVTLLSKNIFQNSGPIILNASNEVLVDSFIKGKITFNSIYLYLRAVFRDKDFRKYAIKKAPNVKEIYRIDKWARRKTIEKINEKKSI